MRLLATLLRRDLVMLLGSARGGTWLPLVFFLAVVVLFPFAVGPDAALLARTGGGIVWIAALLAAILPIDRLIAPDLERGVLDQLALRGVLEESIVAMRIVALWLSFAPLLLLACVVAAALLDLSAAQLSTLLLGLLAGTPGLAASGVLIAALTATVRRGPTLSALLFLPLNIPILVFGAGSLADTNNAGIGLAAATSLALIALTPFAGGAAIRAARD